MILPAHIVIQTKLWFHIKILWFSLHCIGLFCIHKQGQIVVWLVAEGGARSCPIVCRVGAVAKWRQVWHQWQHPSIERLGSIVENKQHKWGLFHVIYNPIIQDRPILFLFQWLHLPATAQQPRNPSEMNNSPILPANYSPYVWSLSPLFI